MLKRKLRLRRLLLLTFVCVVYFFFSLSIFSLFSENVLLLLFSGFRILVRIYLYIIDAVSKIFLTEIYFAYYHLFFLWFSPFASTRAVLGFVICAFLPLTLAYYCVLRRFKLHFIQIIVIIPKPTKLFLALFGQNVRLCQWVFYLWAFWLDNHSVRDGWAHINTHTTTLTRSLAHSIVTTNAFYYWIVAQKLCCFGSFLLVCNLNVSTATTAQCTVHTEHNAQFTYTKHTMQSQRIRQIKCLCSAYIASSLKTSQCDAAMHISKQRLAYFLLLQIVRNRDVQTDRINNCNNCKAKRRKKREKNSRRTTAAAKKKSAKKSIWRVN